MLGIIRTRDRNKISHEPGKFEIVKTNLLAKSGTRNMEVEELWKLIPGSMDC